jgi:hypothetical protein
MHTDSLSRTAHPLTSSALCAGWLWVDATRFILNVSGNKLDNTEKNIAFYAWFSAYDSNQSVPLQHRGLFYSIVNLLPPSMSS